MKTIDLRSDTVTLPTPAMRDAIAHAELGDDVYHEDPTANRLQRMAADMLGKEDALFVASGTMANLVAVLTHCESGRPHARRQRSPHPLLRERRHGAARRRRSPHASQRRRTATSTRRRWRRCSGRAKASRSTSSAWRTPTCAAAASPSALPTPRRSPPSPTDAAPPLHLDGARIFNAAVALGVPAASLAEDVDSVMFCLSKGLCCPVGSILCGSAEFIALARQSRKLVGGGMRQVGVLAAAGIVALESMIDRLAEDHANARAPRRRASPRCPASPSTCRP